MASKSGAARSRSRIDAPETLTNFQMALRVAWIAGVGLWLFMATALFSFDPADWPSHIVAVHNEPTANLCGTVGAILSYGAHSVLGVGSWVIVAGLGGLLMMTANGDRVGHPLLRGIGLLIAAVSLASLHALVLPAVGPLAGAPAGLLGSWLVLEFSPRFSTVGTALLLVVSFSIGVVVAADRLALAIPRLILQAISALRETPQRLRTWFEHLIGRPGARLAVAGGGFLKARTPEEYEDEDEEWEDEDEDEEEYDDEEDEEYEDEEDEDEEEYDEEDSEDASDDADEEESEQAPRRRLSTDELREKIAKLPVRLAGRDKLIARDEDIPREVNYLGYQFPPLDLLQDPEDNFNEKMESLVRRQAEQLEEALQTYGIDGEVVSIESGPAVTLYSIQLAPGTKVAKISGISRDIARALRTQNIRIVPNMVGKTAIGIEVPNLHRERVRLKELMSGGHSEGMVLPMFLGKDAAGEPLVADLTRMPHMLIAGTTGSGKSVCLNTILMSWLYTKRPDELKMVLVDPKMVEMSQFADIPHLMCPVVTESARAASIMEWAVERMEERYELLKEARVRDVAAYNRLSEEDLYERFDAQNDEERARIPKRLPYMVFVVDELADMMLTCKEVEHSIVRIAQKARAVGIHLILATQRPQANVVTGLIKSNMPCRVSFKVSSGMDSRIVLDSKGAELLLGQGDMMFLTPHTSDIRRAQGTLVEDSEIRTVVKFLKTVAAPNFERVLMAIRPGSAEAEGGLDAQERDPLFDQAVEMMIESGRGSVSLLQRRMAVGYGRASRLVDQMALAGILGEHKGSVAREVMITLEEWRRMKEMEEAEEAEGTLFEEEETEEEDADPPVIETSNGDLSRK